MTLPLDLHHGVESALDVRIQAASPLTGGMINQAASVTTTDGTLFLKWKADAPGGFFEAEVRGLKLLHAAGALRVPRVLRWYDACETETNTTNSMGRETSPSWLALEWFERVLPHDEAAFARDFAEALAAQHHVTAPLYGDAQGRSNFLGEFTQDNTPSASWTEFWRDCRILPLISRGLHDERLSPAYQSMLLRVVERAPSLLNECDTRPSLLHGDLWSGNFMPVTDEGEKTCSVVLDPAAYFGSREMEIAYIELFGGFPRGFIAYYHAACPLPARYAQRRPLLQIYPLLVHYLHFGAEYGPPLERACHHVSSS